MVEARLRRRAQRPVAFFAIAATAAVLMAVGTAVLLSLPHP